MYSETGKLSPGRKFNITRKDNLNLHDFVLWTDRSV